MRAAGRLRKVPPSVRDDAPADLRQAEPTPAAARSGRTAPNEHEGDRRRAPQRPGAPSRSAPPTGARRPATRRARELTRALTTPAAEGARGSEANAPRHQANTGAPKRRRGRTARIAAAALALACAWAGPALTGWGAAGAEILVSNMGESLGTGDTRYLCAHDYQKVEQAFTTGANAYGYALDRIQIDIDDMPTDMGDVTVTLRNGSHHELMTFVNPRNTNRGRRWFTRPIGTTLRMEANTGYYIRVAHDSTDECDMRLRTTLSTDEDDDTDEGWEIADNACTREPREASGGLLLAIVDCSLEQIARIRVDGDPLENTGIQQIMMFSSPADGHTYRRGETIEILTVWTRNVLVTGTPKMDVRVGEGAAGYRQAERAPYVEGDRLIRFDYTVRPNDRDDTGIGYHAGVGDGSQGIRGGTIVTKDTAVPVNRAYASRNNITGHKVDGRAYVKRAWVASVPPGGGGTYGLGDRIEFKVQFSEAVVTDSNQKPAAALHIGTGANTRRTFAYESGSGTDTFTFVYTVKSTDSDSNGITIEASTENGSTGLGGGSGNRIVTKGWLGVLANRAYVGAANLRGQAVDGSAAATQSTDATLQSIVVKAGGRTIDLDPAFAAGTLGYTAETRANGSVLTLVITPGNSNATWRVLDSEGTQLQDADTGTSGFQTPLPVGNTTLRIAVTAQNASFKQTYTISATRPEADIAPDPPDAAEGHADAANRIRLAWAAPANTGDSAIAGYRIEVSEDEGTAWTTLVARTAAVTRSYAHTGLDELTKYRYRIYTVNENGHESTPSTLVQATTWEDFLCDRTEQVKTEIARQILGGDAARCGEATAALLATITEMNLSSKGITALRAGDLDELTGLRTLSLAENVLTSLPAGLLDDPSGLRTFNISNNTGLGTLAARLLSGTTGLTEFRARNIRLTSVPAGLFSPTTDIETIDLGGNRLASMPSGVFSARGSLDEIRLDSNRFTTVPDGLFRGLNNVPTTIDLSGNPVDPLELTVGVELRENEYAHVVIPGGAPGNLDIPLSIANGLVANSASLTVSIPRGSTESEGSTVTRSPGATGAVTATIGTLPSLPAGYTGFELAKASADPIELLGEVNVTAPGAPTDLRAVPGVASATLTWTAPAEDGDSPVTGYDVCRIEGTDMCADSGWEAMEGSGAGTTSHTVVALTDGTRYTFRVRARNVAGPGAASNAASVTPGLAGDATLSALRIEDATGTVRLFPYFHTRRSEFTARVGHASATVTVHATPTDANATVAWVDGAGTAIPDADGDAATGHQAALSVGANTVRARVTAEDGHTTRDYTVAIHRSSTGEITLTLDEGDGLKPYYEFGEDTLAFTGEGLTLRAETGGGTRPAGDVVIAFELSGTATNGLDYETFDPVWRFPRAGFRLEHGRWTQTRTKAFVIIDDATVETTESVVLALPATSARGGARAAALQRRAVHRDDHRDHRQRPGDGRVRAERVRGARGRDARRDGDVRQGRGDPGGDPGAHTGARDRAPGRDRQGARACRLRSDARGAHVRARSASDSGNGRDHRGRPRGRAGGVPDAAHGPRQRRQRRDRTRDRDRDHPRRRRRRGDGGAGGARGPRRGERRVHAGARADPRRRGDHRHRAGGPGDGAPAPRAVHTRALERAADRRGERPARRRRQGRAGDAPPHRDQHRHRLRRARRSTTSR